MNIYSKCWTRRKVLKCLQVEFSAEIGFKAAPGDVTGSVKLPATLFFDTGKLHPSAASQSLASKTRLAVVLLGFAFAGIKNPLEYCAVGGSKSLTARFASYCLSECWKIGARPLNVFRISLPGRGRNVVFAFPNPPVNGWRGQVGRWVGCSGFAGQAEGLYGQPVRSTSPQLVV